MKKNPHSPRVQVRVTEDIIANACRRNSGHCMIADAVKAAYPAASYVSVDLQSIRFTDLAKGLRYTYFTPRKAQLALVKFDAGEVPEPMGINLTGGQVTRSGSARSLSRQGTPKRDPVPGDEIGRRKFVRPKKSSATSVPEKIGGQTPPVAGLPWGAGLGNVPKRQRRQFGLRALDFEPTIGEVLRDSDHRP